MGPEGHQQPAEQTLLSKRSRASAAK